MVNLIEELKLIAVRMENLRVGDWDEIQNKAHCVQSMYSRSRLFSYLDRAQQIPWNEFSQDLMRFWGYESLFSTILYRWRFVFQ